MTERQETEAQIRELLAAETSAIRLSNKLFAPDGLFSRLAHTEGERRELVQGALFKEAQERLTVLQKAEVAGLVRTADETQAAMPQAASRRSADRPMNAEELRALQLPIKNQYRDDPASAQVTLRAHGHVGEGITCRVQTGQALVEAGLHPATGGDGLAACSGEMLLEALVACAGVTLRAVATAIGVELRDGTVTAEGDLDFRGTLGVSKEAPVGFTAIRLQFHLDTDAGEEQLASLIRLTERYCVVYQTLRQAPEITLSCLNGRPA